MSKKYIVVAALMTTTFILSMIINNSLLAPKIKKSSVNQGNQPATLNNPAVPSNKGNSMEGLQSGRVSRLPWENNADFLSAQQQAETPVLLAAYCTVLCDPLPGEEENVHLAAAYLKGILVEPGQVFSQNESLGPYTVERGFREGPTYMGSHLAVTTGGGVCKMASTLYNVTVLSNLPVVERHAHTMPVPYVPYGQDATVAYGAKDFKFKNCKSNPILMWAEGVENRLYVALYGQEAPPRVEWVHQQERLWKSYTIYHYNPGMPRGSERVAVEGMDGATIRSWIKIIHDDGSYELFPRGLSCYSPLPRIVERN